MNHWSKSAYGINGLREKLERHEYIDAEAVCTGYLTDHAGESSDEVIGMYLLRARCRAALGCPEDAVTDHRQAIALMGDSPDLEQLFDAAADAVNDNIPLDYCASVLRYCAEKMAAHKPPYPPGLVAAAYNKEGICHFKSGGPVEDEIFCFTRAHEIMDFIASPDGDDLLLLALIKGNLAECYARSGDLDNSARLYQDALDIYSERREKSAVCTDQYAACLRNLSDLCRNRGDNIAAHKNLSRAIEALEAHPDGMTEQTASQLASAYNARGTLRYNMGDYDGEVADCTRALDLRRQSPPDHFGCATVHANRAEAYEQLREYDLAASDYRSAIEKLKLAAGELPLAGALIAMRYFSLGNLLCEQGDIEGAMEAMTSSAEQFLAMRDTELDTYSPEQMREMESLCRLRLAQLAYDDRRCNYHIAMTEMRRAISLLEELEPTPIRVMRLSSMHTAMGELYEIFDEFECAAQEYATAEMLHIESCDSLADLAAQQEEAVDDEDGVWAEPSGTIPQA